jgi:hypothetical protein
MGFVLDVFSFSLLRQPPTMNAVFFLALLVASASAFVSKTPFVSSNARNGALSLSMAMERTYIMVGRKQRINHLSPTSKQPNSNMSSEMPTDQA